MYFKMLYLFLWCSSTYWASALLFRLHDHT